MTAEHGSYNKESKISARYHYNVIEEDEICNFENQHN